jgi:hypothetical protein
MAFQQTTKQPEPIQVWLDPDTPDVTGSLIDGDALVEFTASNGMRGFVRLPIDQIPGVAAALQAIHSTLT